MIRYAIAHEDWFGQWSPWATADAQPAEPKVEKVSLVSGRLQTAALPPPPGSVCDATLTLDLTWDWTVRRPKRLLIAGRLYAAAKPGDPPANLSVPVGLQTNFPGGAGVAFVITFNGGNTGAGGGRVHAELHLRRREDGLAVAGRRRRATPLPAHHSGLQARLRQYRPCRPGAVGARAGKPGAAANRRLVRRTACDQRVGSAPTGDHRRARGCAADQPWGRARRASRPARLGSDAGISRLLCL